MGCSAGVPAPPLEDVQGLAYIRTCKQSARVRSSVSVSVSYWTGTRLFTDENVSCSNETRSRGVMPLYDNDVLQRVSRLLPSR